MLIPRKSLGLTAICLRRMSHSVQVKERKVRIPSGQEINVVKAGNGEKSVLLMPGALGGAWSDFKPQIEKLPEILPNHTIYAWDPPGYGKSNPGKRTFPLDFYNKDSQWSNELMQELGKSKYSIVGWSDGGVTGLISAGTYVDSVEKLAIWGAGSYYNSNEAKMFDNIRDVSKWSERMRKPMEEMYGVEGFPKLWSGWVDGALDIIKKSGGNLCKEELSKIKAPVFILHGKKDPMFDGEEHIPYLKENIKNWIYHEFPEGKHNIHLRYADEFNQHLSRFLNE